MVASDVLFRHMKCHTEKKEPETPSAPSAQPSERRSTISEGIRPQVQHQNSTGAVPHNGATQSQSGIPLMQILSPSNYISSREAEIKSQARHGSIDYTTSHMDPPTLQQQHIGMQMSSDWAGQAAINPLVSFSNPSNPHRASPSQKSADISVYDTSITSSNQPAQTPPSEVPQSQYGNANMDWLPASGMAQGDYHDPFQMWLFPSLGDLDQSPDFLQTFNTGATPNFAVEDTRPLNEKRQAETSDRPKTIKTVPRERFSRIQKCWAPRPHRLHRIMPSLWRDVISSPLDNLFTDEDSNFHTQSKSTSNWGLDSDCRHRLKATFRTPAPSAYQSPRLNATLDPLIAPNLSDASEFPPAEILDIALGLFFRRFHPTVPFIHVPTFSVKHTPAPFLFAVCLIGLSILGTTGATRFVSKMFPSFLQRVSAEMMSCASGTASATQQMTNFATALLVLNLAVMTGDKDTLQQSQMLYVSLMAMVQQNGLFSTCDGQNLDDLLSDMNESENQWKAWSRVESAKRLILSLLTLDSWYSNLLYRAPIVRSEIVSVYAPCDEPLFQAKSATQWQSLIRSGKRETAPMIRIEDLHASRIDPAIPLGCLGSSTLLALIQIQILESYHRLLPADQQIIGCLIPWQLYANDLRARSLTAAVLAAEASCGPSMRKSDTNCIVLWHSLCIMLLADFRMFELAAGRHGAGPAADALDKIARWSQTVSARRAVVHAAQNFKLMSERKVSDNVTIHSVTAVFASALILGLYLFMVPPSTNHSNRTTVELIDTDVDWQEMHDVGFTNDETDLHINGKGLPRHDHDLSLIHHFIRYGGTVSLSGVTHQGGYESARRVLLDFANLMDGISGRKLRTFTQVLHIMSDDLMNVDTAL